MQRQTVLVEVVKFALQYQINNFCRQRKRHSINATLDRQYSASVIVTNAMWAMWPEKTSWTHALTNTRLP